MAAVPAVALQAGPLLPIHSNGVCVVAMQYGLQFCAPGRAEVRPSSTPPAVDVLNQTPIPRLSAPLTPVSTRPLSPTWMQELTWPGVVHQAPSSGMNELVPLKLVAVTPEIGPGTPAVVPNSAAGGSSVARSSTGTWLAAVVAPAASLSR